MAEQVDIYDVIVVGGGVAGVQCATTLSAARSGSGSKLKILILEAKDSIGGRIKQVCGSSV
jgi:flavin-dependent dehydrogenase